MTAVHGPLAHAGVAQTHIKEIASAARAVLDREVPRDALLARLRSEPYSTAAWSAAAQAGWFQLLTSEARGGLDAGAAEVAAIFTELGRHLVAGPFAETVVAGGLARSDADLGPDDAVIAYARLDAPVGGEPISAVLPAVEHSDVAGVLLLGAEVDGQPALLRLDAQGDGVASRRMAAFDTAGGACRVELEAAPFEVLVAGPVAGQLLDRIHSLLAVARAATLAGIARELLDMSVQYARDRSQFGQPIGAYQAVQQRLADMAVSTAGIASAVDAAGAAASVMEAEALCALAAEMARGVAYGALQVHGGIGFTAEHPLHAYLKRVLRLQAVAGERDPLARVGARLIGS